MTIVVILMKRVRREMSNLRSI